MSSSNDDYTPPEYSTGSADDFLGDPLIEKLHGYIHIGAEDYETEKGVPTQDYGQSVAGFFFSVLVIGIFCMLVLWLFNLCSCCACCRRCFCLKPCFATFEGKPRTGKAVVIVMFFLSGIMATCSYAGRNIFQDAVDRASGDLRALAGIFDEFENHSEDMVANTNIYYASTEKVACTGTGASEMNQSLFDVQSAFAVAANALLSLTSGLGNKIRDAADDFEEEVPPYIDLGLGLLTALVWVNWLLGSIAIMISCCKFDDCLVLIFGSLTMLLLIVVVATEHTFAVTLADFCYPGPENSLMETADNNLISYFLKCVGQSPFAPQFDSARGSVADYTRLIDDIKADPLLSCNDAALDEILATNTEMSGVINAFETSAGCPEINPLFLGVLHDLLCGDFVRGLFVCTMVHTAAGFMLWLTYMVFPCAANTKPLVDKPSELRRLSTSDLKGQLARDAMGTKVAPGMADDEDFFKDDAPDPSKAKRDAPTNPDDPWDLPGTDDDPPPHEPIALDASGKEVDGGNSSERSSEGE